MVLISFAAPDIIQEFLYLAPKSNCPKVFILRRNNNIMRSVVVVVDDSLIGRHCVTDIVVIRNGNKL